MHHFNGHFFSDYLFLASNFIFILCLGNDARQKANWRDFLFFIYIILFGSVYNSTAKLNCRDNGCHRCRQPSVYYKREARTLFTWGRVQNVSEMGNFMWHHFNSDLSPQTFRECHRRIIPCHLELVPPYPGRRTLSPAFILTGWTLHPFLSCPIPQPLLLLAMLFLEALLEA